MELAENILCGDWKRAIQSMLDTIAHERDLPKHSLYLKANVSRDGQKIVSYSVLFDEPDYPLPRNGKRVPLHISTVLRIKETRKRIELLICTSVFKHVAAPEEAEIKNVEADSANTHVLFPKGSYSLVSYIKRITEYELENYVSQAATFGCCNKFIECSDAKRCVHENKLYSKACSYRANLESGRIFYGKNRNIE